MTKDNLCILLGLVAGLLHLAAYGLYLYRTERGQAAPNPASWTVWAAVSLLNLASFFVMSGDWIKAILPASSSVACILVFCVALVRGRFGKIGRLESLTLLAASVSVAVWYLTKNAAWANLTLQAAEFVSFWPTIADVRRDSTSERPLSWSLWALGYAFLLATVILRWNGCWAETVYPANLLVLHLVIAVLTLHKPKKI